ncbi:MAG: glycoside hydrolase family 5 protein [Defluviitaleaceae bacterium]|nr:glycoside hydrolase family 5 protein [Defluviitaleaceae bacterium]
MENSSGCFSLIVAFALSTVLIFSIAACSNNDAAETIEANETIETVEDVPLTPEEITEELALTPRPETTPLPIPAPRDPETPNNPGVGVAINLTEPPIAPDESPWRDAAEMVSEMRVGWNLGNTLDAWRRNMGGTHIAQHETIWGNPVTSRENIEVIRDAGFDVLRVPVTWHQRFVIGCDDYTIREDWMNRVQTVVDYGMDAGMFVILNTHHDEYIFSLYDDYMEESVHVITRLWEQISYVFRDYGHKLIFEGLNEPRTIGSRGEWSGGTPEERENVNVLNQVFVDTVRASGGNNINRMLMVPTYAASVEVRAIEDLVIPDDPLNDENKIIVSLHMYAPYEFALTLGGRQRTGWTTQNPEDTGAIERGMDRAVDAFTSRGIPVILGEMGALNRDNLGSRVNWTYFYVNAARERGMVCIWWDNGRFGVSRDPSDGDHFAILDRRTNTFPFPEIIDALMQGSEPENE